MNRTRACRIKAVAAAVIALCAASVSLSVTSASASASTVSKCTGPGDLRLRISSGHRSGTSGITNYTLDVTNVSRSECSLSGYPAASLISRAGKQLGSPAGHGLMTIVPLVILAPGATAHTTLAYNSGIVNARHGCGPVVTAFELRVSLAVAQKPALYARLAVRACSHPGNTYLRITQAFRSGPG